MILTANKNDVLVVGENTSQHAKISDNKLSKLQYLLTKGLYKDPITAVIAEWTNNGIDAVVQAGKDPLESPVIVRISKNTQGQYIFSVEDKGTGLDDRDFRDICMNYLESTKEDDNDTIGHFGIGMKSFLALERPATFTCIKDGVERKYLVYEGEEFVDFDMVYEQKTKAENGVKAEITLNNYSEKELFVSKIKSKLCYYDTVIIDIEGKILQNTIHRHPLFQWSEMTKFSSLHIALKDVYYPIDWDALGIRQISVPIAIRIGLNEGMKPTPSRESYISNEATKRMIINKLKELGKFFADIYNSRVFQAKTLLEGFQYINDYNPFVEIEGQQFQINELVKLSGSTLHPVKIDGMSMMTPNFYKNNVEKMFYQYKKIAHITRNGEYRGKDNYYTFESFYVKEKKPVVLLSFQPYGNYREFLKHKYGGVTNKEVLFVVKLNKKRKLWDENNQFDDYHYILSLGRGVHKKDWRRAIQEWQNIEQTMFANFDDQTKIFESKEYTDWLEAKREAQRLARASKPKNVKTKNSLNKQAGDVTMAYSKAKRYGGRFFEKSAIPISSIQSNEYLTVVVDEEDKKSALSMSYMMSKTLHIQFALVGKLEQKKLPQTYQFIKFKDFMSTKPFGRLATAILIHRELEKYTKIYNRVGSIVSHCLAKEIGKVKADLVIYKEKYYHDTGDDPVEDYIIQEATANKSFDLSIWDKYVKFRDAVKKFEFVTVLEAPPSYMGDDLKGTYKRVINQMLLFRKKYYNDLDKIEIDVKFV